VKIYFAMLVGGHDTVSEAWGAGVDAKASEKLLISAAHPRLATEICLP